METPQTELRGRAWWPARRYRSSWFSHSVPSTWHKPRERSGNQSLEKILGEPFYQPIVYRTMLIGMQNCKFKMILVTLKLGWIIFRSNVSISMKFLAKVTIAKVAIKSPTRPPNMEIGILFREENWLLSVKWSAYFVTIARIKRMPKQIYSLVIVVCIRSDPMH